MKILLIRHGQTRGNFEKRYIGRTDQPLDALGEQQARALLLSGALPHADSLTVSPYLRCRQTAALVFPNMPFTIEDDIRECDFGEFEAKTADELTENSAYNAWLASGCTAAIPGGESIVEFKARCARAFKRHAVLGEYAAFVTHGGCIMAILEQFALPKRSFYEYYIPNCGFVLCDYDGSSLTIASGALC
ncbi:MAG: histidine phosphatase family protein [Clostridia bacterium]